MVTQGDCVEITCVSYGQTHVMYLAVPERRVADCRKRLTGINGSTDSMTDFQHVGHSINHYLCIVIQVHQVTTAHLEYIKSGKPHSGSCSQHTYSKHGFLQSEGKEL